MTQNVTEEKKKPIETAWDLVGRDLKWGVGLLAAGALVFGVGMGLIAGVEAPPIDSLVIASRYLRYAAGVLAALGGWQQLRGRSLLKSFTVSSKNKVSSIWDQAKGELFEVNYVGGMASLGIGTGIGNYIVKNVFSFPLLAEEKSAVLLIGGVLLGGLAVKGTKKGFAKLRSFKKKVPAQQFAPNP